MSNTLTKTRTTTKSEEREEIIWDGQNESKERKKDEEKDASSFMSREKIGEEKLIKSERERFSTELTSLTRITFGAKTKEIIWSLRIPSQTATIGATMCTLIEMIFIVETLDSGVILFTDAKIDIISETETSVIIDAQLMISNRRRFSIEKEKKVEGLERISKEEIYHWRMSEDGRID